MGLTVTGRGEGRGGRDMTLAISMDRESAIRATALGAMLFFWGRVAHAVVYVAGIPYLRTAAFGVSLLGLVRIAGELF